ncbi:MAG TPA: hypothetical protein DCE56_21710 [Cyanobacteria bacterium UBA8553]|nr:hypothetical protein [Cyanobacteria bacterium UBA8553]
MINSTTTVFYQFLEASKKVPLGVPFPYSDSLLFPYSLGKLIEGKWTIAQIKQRSQPEAHTVG